MRIGYRPWMRLRQQGSVQAPGGCSAISPRSGKSPSCGRTRQPQRLRNWRLPGSSRAQLGAEQPWLAISCYPPSHRHLIELIRNLAKVRIDGVAGKCGDVETISPAIIARFASGDFTNAVEQGSLPVQIGGDGFEFVAGATGRIGLSHGASPMQVLRGQAGLVLVTPCPPLCLSPSGSVVQILMLPSTLVRALPGW